MRIVVNGKEHDIEQATEPFTYEEVVAIAHEGNEATVTYHGPKRGDSRRSGTLSRGKSVELEDGMIFNVVTTGNA